MGFHHIVLLCCLLFGETVSPREEEKCPLCEHMFTKLENTGASGKLIQDVNIQERGEPKSGTGFMFDWGAGALEHLCQYLKETFGDKSCRMEIGIGEMAASKLANRTMIFEPSLATENARCPCDNVERVSITVSKLEKHILPVSDDCAYRHPRGIDTGERHEHQTKSVCIFADGTPIVNYEDLRRCIQEASCATAENGWLQMAVLRDPRPMAVSAYYHLGRHTTLGWPPGNGDVMEAFVMGVLPIMCQWVAVRYIFFGDLMSSQSMIFWYHDALTFPRVWHDRWFGLAGLLPPVSVVEDTISNALEGKFSFGVKQRDEHTGAEYEVVTGAKMRRFEDEVSPKLLKEAEKVLRTWLPLPLLVKIGVPVLIVS